MQVSGYDNWKLQESPSSTGEYPVVVSIKFLEDQDLGYPFLCDVIEFWDNFGNEWIVDSCEFPTVEMEDYPMDPNDNEFFCIDMDKLDAFAQKHLDRNFDWEKHA